MRKTTTLILIILLVLAFLGILFFNGITGKVIEGNDSNFSYTKAICNSSKYCQDYEIRCFGNKSVSIKPITGAVVQFDSKWRDPRDKEEIEKLC